MGYATEIFQNVDNHLVNFVAEKSQAVSLMLEPTATVGMGIVILFLGARHMFGEIEQPITAFIKTTFKMAGITWVALTAGEYNTLVVSTFQDSPAALAAALSGTSDGTVTGGMGAILDGIWDNCFLVGKSFWDAASMTAPGGYIIGPATWAFAVLVTGYSAYLIVLAKIMTGLALAVGPIFIVGLLFEKTQGYFGSFINVLINYGLVGALSVGSISLILSMFSQTAIKMAAQGGTTQLVDLGGIFIAGLVGLLVLMQVKNIASALAGGISMETFGVARAGAGVAGKVASAALKGGASGAQKVTKAARDKLRPRNSIQETVSRKERLMPRQDSSWRTGT